MMPLSTPSLQDRLDEILHASRQQWALRAMAVLAPLAAVLAAAQAARSWWPFGLVLVPILSVASILRADSGWPMLVPLVVVWHWLAAVDDLATPWLPVAASCLLVHHVVVALAATVPVGGRLPDATLRLWATRSAVGVAMTIGMWALVVAFERREAPGNGLLTGLALAVVAAAAVAIRARSLPAERTPPRRNVRRG